MVALSIYSYPLHEVSRVKNYAVQIELDIPVQIDSRYVLPFRCDAHSEEVESQAKTDMFPGVVLYSSGDTRERAPWKHPGFPA